MSAANRVVVVAPQAKGWAVIARYEGGSWDGWTTTSYHRWYWQAQREYDRVMRRAVQP